MVEIKDDIKNRKSNSFRKITLNNKKNLNKRPSLNNRTAFLPKLSSKNKKLTRTSKSHRKIYP